MTMFLTGCGSNDTEGNATPTTSVSANSEVDVEGTTAVESVDSEEVNQAKQGKVVEIKEKMFLTQMNDIFLNYDDYVGKTIKYEGIYSYLYDELTDSYISFVYRNSPGCCGDDGIAGFEVVYEGEPVMDEEWVEVVGTLETYELDGNEYIRLVASSMTVLSERGAEYVSQ